MQALYMLCMLTGRDVRACLNTLQMLAWAWHAEHEAPPQSMQRCHRPNSLSTRL